MNVYFDQQIFMLQNYGGISKYFLELIIAIKRNKNINTEIVSPFTINEQAAAYLHLNDKLFTSVPFKPLLAKLSLMNQSLLTGALLKGKCSRNKTVLHETYYTHRTRVKCPVVTTVHDMIYERFSSGNYAQREVIGNKRKAVEAADAIIAVSTNTKKELVELYPSVADRVHVIHHGVSGIDAEKVLPYKHQKLFILFVGNRGWYKNFDRLLKVYAADKKINEHFDIICAGGGALSGAENSMISRLHIKGKVYHLAGDDQLLNSLYKSASCLAYVSTHEGFGMPVLEAMRFGCPVLCSDGSSLPEVAGDAAILLDVENEQALATELSRILFDDQKRIELFAAGKLRANEFSWETCADRTVELYTALI